MEIKGRFKYLVSSDKDARWGLTIESVGTTVIPEGYDVYPPRLPGHPNGYLFTPENGRVLDSFQLIYISHGRGVYSSAPEKRITILAGDLFLLRPGVWHSYMPDRKTGWVEYWIELRGRNIDNRFFEGFFEPDKAVYHLGVREEIIALYENALEVAHHEHTAYQQLLAGIANMILGMMIYHDSNLHHSDDVMLKRIDRAKALMRESMGTNVGPEQIARQVGMSYSWFRRSFHQYTSLSPVEYMQGLTLHKARALLLSTDLSIKEIAYDLSYSDASYFSARFRKFTGLSPSQYREKFVAKV